MAIGRELPQVGCRGGDFRSSCPLCFQGGSYGNRFLLTMTSFPNMLCYLFGA